ncbi:MAG: M48 family metallopeptidase [Bryobacteraceae bacterium]|nr:M48 family metallopeptidase [Bryobacteraceae bacterium]
MTMVLEAKKRKMRQEVAHWAEKIGVKPKRVQIQRMTVKWASCSTAGRVCFSADLLDEPSAFQEVVIVHELLHLLVPNHGKLFKSLMKAHLPGWERVAREREVTICGGSEAHVEIRKTKSVDRRKRG